MIFNLLLDLKINLNLNFNLIKFNMNSTIQKLMVENNSFLLNAIVIGSKFFEKIFLNIFAVPLMILYFYGPEFLNTGFWNGRSALDICARSTGLSPDFWAEVPGKCELVVYEKFVNFCHVCASFIWSLWFSLCVYRLLVTGCSVFMRILTGMFVGNFERIENLDDKIVEKYHIGCSSTTACSHRQNLTTPLTPPRQGIRNRVSLNPRMASDPVE